VHRKEFSSAFLYAGSGVLAQEVADGNEMSIILRVSIRSFSYVESLKDVYVLKFHTSGLAKNFHQMSGLSAVVAGNDEVVVSYVLYSFFCSYKFALINFLPIHYVLPFFFI
jgi:hypothetical protein